MIHAGGLGCAAKQSDLAGVAVAFKNACSNGAPPSRVDGFLWFVASVSQRGPPVFSGGYWVGLLFTVHGCEFAAEPFWVRCAASTFNGFAVGGPCDGLAFGYADDRAGGFGQCIARHVEPVVFVA